MPISCVDPELTIHVTKKALATLTETWPQLVFILPLLKQASSGQKPQTTPGMPEIENQLCKIVIKICGFDGSQ